MRKAELLLMFLILLSLPHAFALAYDDGLLPGENLHITSNKSHLTGISDDEITFEIKNLSKKKQTIEWSFLFSAPDAEIVETEVWSYGINQTMNYINNECTLSQKCEDSFCFNVCNETGKSCFTSSCSYLTTEPGITFGYDWRKHILTNTKRIKKNKGERDWWTNKKGQVIIDKYGSIMLKAKVKYPIGSSGEFLIEAIGDKDGYGLLDPWWDSTFLSRAPVVIKTSLDSNALITISVDSVALIAAGLMESDCNDLRVVYQNDAGQSEVPFFSIDANTCNNPDSNLFVHFKVPHPVVADTLADCDANNSICLYYTKTGASASTKPTPFLATGEFNVPLGNSGSLFQIGTANCDHNSVSDSTLDLNSYGAGSGNCTWDTNDLYDAWFNDNNKLTMDIRVNIIESDVGATHGAGGAWRTGNHSTGFEIADTGDGFQKSATASTGCLFPQNEFRIFRFIQDGDLTELWVDGNTSVCNSWINDASADKYFRLNSLNDTQDSHWQLDYIKFSEGTNDFISYEIGATEPLKITADFTININGSLDPEAGISSVNVDFNDSTTSHGLSIVDWGWFDLNVIDSMDSITGWTDDTISTPPTLDLSTRIEGIASINMGKDATTGSAAVYQHILSSTLNMDRNSFVWIYIADANIISNLTAVRLEVFDAENDKGQYTLTSANMNVGWQRLGGNIDDWTITGALNQDRINKIKIYSVSGAGLIYESGKLKFDLWYTNADGNFSTDQNNSQSYSLVDDYNVALHAFDSDGNSHIKWQTFSITEAPQDVNFTWSPIGARTDTNVTFLSTTSSEVNSDWKWTWQDNSAYFSTDQNTWRVFGSSGDHNICITATSADDANKTYCNTVPIYGRARFRFIDQTMGSSLQPNIVINGNSYSADAGGVIDLNLFGFSNPLSVSAYDNNHPIRYFEWDINNYTQIDENLSLLETVNGQDIAFKFYEADDASVIGNAYVEVLRINDNNVHSRRKTSADGTTTMFLNGIDGNYYFRITRAAGTVVDYNAIKVTVKPPKDEATYQTIIPTNYILEFSGLGSGYVSGISSDYNFYILGNTVNNYIVNVDVNTEFYDRYYYLQINGSDNNYILQPYLVDTGTGVSTKVITLNNISGVTVPNTTVLIYRNIPGSGRTLIESVTTDAKGEALISGVVNNTYSFEVYYGGSLISTANIVVTSEIIYVYFNPTSEAPVPTTNPYITISFNPSSGKLLGESSLEQDMNVVGTSFSQILIYVTQIDVNNSTNDVNLYTTTISGGFTYPYVNTIDINTSLSGWDHNMPVIVTVNVIASNGATLTSKQMYYAYVGSRPGDYALNFIKGGGFKQLWGCEVDEDCGVTMLFSIILTLFACAAVVTVTPIRDAGPTVIIAGGALGLFTYIGWFPLFWFIMFAFLAFVGALVSWRVMR